MEFISHGSHSYTSPILMGSKLAIHEVLLDISGVKSQKRRNMITNKDTDIRWANMCNPTGTAFQQSSPEDNDLGCRESMCRWENVR